MAKFLAATCQTLVTGPGRRLKGLHSYCWHDPTRCQEDGQFQGFVHKIEGCLIGAVRQHADESRLGDHQAHHDRCETRSRGRSCCGRVGLAYMRNTSERERRSERSLVNPCGRRCYWHGTEQRSNHKRSGCTPKMVIHCSCFRRESLMMTALHAQLCQRAS